jgi:hypothetical protein
MKQVWVLFPFREKTKCQYALVSSKEQKGNSRVEKEKKGKHIFNMIWKVACASKPCVIMKLTKSWSENPSAYSL